MAAQPKPFIHSVDDKGFVHYTRGGVEQKTYWLDLDKVALITVAKFLGYRFTGSTPLKWSLDEIRAAVQSVMTAKTGSQFVPAPTKSVPAPKMEVPMSQPKVEQAIQNLLDAVQNMQGSTVDESTIRRIATEVTTSKLVDTEASIFSLTKHFDDEVGNLAVKQTKFAVDLSEVAKRVDNLQPKVVQIVLPNLTTKKLDGVQHEQFPKVLTALNLRLSIMMVGPAGTGKTTIASSAAHALDMDFSSKSCTAQTTESSLVGFINAAGNYVTTEFRKRFEDGGVFLLDEVDNANPNVLGVLNSALANGEMAFPDGMVKRHSDFVCLAAGNTYGNGATTEYVGRNPIDAATKDRFVFIDVNIDERVEEAMLASIPLNQSDANRWLVAVRKARKNVETAGLKVVVSPRATMYGAKLLAAGWEPQDVVAATLLKGAKADQVAKIMEGVTL